MADSMPVINDGVDNRFYLRDRLTGVSFLVDTGSARTIVIATENEEQEEVCDLGLRLLDITGTSLPIHGKRLVKFDFGRGRQFRWHCIIGDKESMVPVIGADFLAFYGLVVDVKNQRLETLNLATNRLEKRSWKFGDVKEWCLPEPRPSQGAKYNGNFVFVEGKTSFRRKVSIAVDTGSTVSCIQKEATSAFCRSCKRKASELKWYGFRKVEFRLPGRKEKCEWTFCVASPLQVNLLGADYLSSHAVRVDCRNKRLLLRPAETGEARNRPVIVSTILKVVTRVRQ